MVQMRVNWQKVFQGVRFSVHRVNLPARSGESVQRDACVTPEAVVILPIFDRDTVVMIRNERFAVGQTLWELPAGTVEYGEPIVECAGRELIEETGYRAGRLAHLVDFYPSPGICTENMHAYLAEDLQHVGQHLDDNEQIFVEVMPLSRSMQMVKDNTIRDGKTMAVLLYYQTFVASGSLD